MSEELKGCLFCGGKLVSVKGIAREVLCKKCAMYWAIEDVQNSWCWKEIDRLKEENENLRIELELGEEE